MENTTQTQVLITKDMTIGEIAEKFPSAVNVMTAYGLHCVGCHSNPFETLEQGMMGHGMDEGMLEKMLHDLNDAAKNDQGHEGHGHSHEGHDHSHGGHEHGHGHAHGGELHQISGEFKINLTDKAASKIKGIMQSENKPNFGLRVGAMPGGCSGFRYMLEFEDAPKKDDTIVEAHGVKMFVDNSMKDMLNQLQIDFVEGLNESGFKITNPNAHSTCGCGSSFH